MYTAEISRANPSCFVFLIDQSGSMAEPIAGSVEGKRKCDSVAGMAHAIRYFVEARENEVQMARLSEQLSSARFSALQAQLNPHFLFNTLNTIAVRARDGDGAVRHRWSNS